LTFAAAPPGYYDSVDASTPALLRSTLHAVIDDHTRFPYTASSTDTWDILNLADQTVRIESAGRVRSLNASVAAALALSLWRLLRGPSAADRILALDTLYINTIALVVLLGIHLGSALYFEAALLIALMGFVGTVALAKYLLRGDIIE
jgi:multicomponent K+:H+ antiporter subunit F